MSDAHGTMSSGGSVRVYELCGKDGCNGRYAHASGMYAVWRLSTRLFVNGELRLTGEICYGRRVGAGHAIGTNID